MIARNIRELLFVPEYYTDEYNATPMKNYWPFLEVLIRTINPKSVCEIGSERGLTSQLLGQTLKNIRSLHIVDPCISKELKRNKTENMILHEMSSLEFFKKELEVELYLIDGDHNYYTVKNELSGVERNRKAGQKTFVLLHDVSWMWARRDMYYSPDSIPEKHEYQYNMVLNLEEKNNMQYGFPGGINYAISTVNGGPKNGVLTAIEDFIAESELSWKFSYIPSLWGLGFLWLEENLNDEEKQDISSLLEKLLSLKEFFGILEANRLRLLQGLDEWRGLANEKIYELQDIGKEREELYAVAEERLKEINRLAGEREELYRVAEERLKEINRLGKEREELYAVAEERLKEVNLLAGEREELYKVAEERLFQIKKLNSNIFIKILKKAGLVR